MAPNRALDSRHNECAVGAVKEKQFQSLGTGPEYEDTERRKALAKVPLRPVLPQCLLTPTHLCRSMTVCERGVGFYKTACRCPGEGPSALQSLPRVGPTTLELPAAFH